MYLFYWWANYKVISFMSHDHSIPSTIMLQWWGNDKAVQSQCYLPSSHCHLTLPQFHCNPLTLAIVCLCSTVIASPSHCNATSTLPYNYPLILPDVLTANVLRWCCQLYSKTTSVLHVKKTALWLRVFSIFENPDCGTDITCEFVNFCSLRLVVVVPSSSVNGAIENFKHFEKYQNFGNITNILENWKFWRFHKFHNFWQNWKIHTNFMAFHNNLLWKDIKVSNISYVYFQFLLTSKL